jgi:hypothetical protein
MKNFNEVVKGLGGLVNLWDTMANKGILEEFRRRNKPLSYYWRAVKFAMASSFPKMEILQDGFWPSSMFGLAIEDEFLDDGIVREEYAKDAPFVERRRHCPTLSF